MFVGNICLVHRAIPPGCSVSLKENKYSEYAASATIHEAMMKNGQCLLLMSGERIGTTTAPMQIDPLLSESGSESTLQRKRFKERSLS